MPDDSYARRLLPHVASVAHGAEDPSQIGRLLAALDRTRAGQPPQQAAQPPLAVSHAVPDFRQSDTTPNEVAPEPTIGASRMGERYIPPSWNEIMGMQNPLRGIAEHALGAARPPSVYAADPTGVDTWTKYPETISPPGLMLGATEEVSTLGRGLFSRIDDLLGQVPEKGVHPNRLAGLLKSVSQEEVNYRNLPALISGKAAANQPITRAELAAHLQAHPAPFPEVTTLGGANPARPTTLPEGYSIQPVQQESRFGLRRFTLQGPDGSGQLLHADTPEDALGEALTRLHPRVMPTLPTKYQTYTLPGGENYREHLLQLPDPVATQRADLQRQIDAKLGEIKGMTLPKEITATPEQYHASPQYQQIQQIIAEHNALNDQLRALPPAPAGYSSGHFDQPNILAHVRTTERTLPGAPPPEPPPVPSQTGADLAQQGWTVRVDKEDPYSGRRQMTLLSPEGEWSGSRGMTSLTPEEYLHEHAQGLNKDAFEEQAAQLARPTGPRGRFIEEIQSDWHQQGKKQGYQTPPGPERQARLAQLPPEIAAARGDLEVVSKQLEIAERAYHEQLRARTRANLPPEWAHLTSFSDATEGGRDAVDAWRAARDPLREHPELEGLRWANIRADQAQTDAITRLNDLREEHRLLVAGPRTGVPDAPFKESWPDLALKQQILDVARDPHANWLAHTGAQTHIDRYGTERLAWQREGNGFRVSYEPQVGGDALGEGLDLGEEALRRGLIRNDSSYVETPEDLGRLLGGDSDVKAEKAWKRIQAQPEGGIYLPRKEGMEAFYDRALPAKLQKLLKPFGGTVEPFQVPTSARRSVPGGTGTVPNNPQGWIARLSPEMKASILKKGFPLAALLAMLMPEDANADTITPPQQSGQQPPLASKPYETVGPPLPPTPPASDAWRKAETIGSGVQPTIGASRVGEQYVPPSWHEMMAMDNPLRGIVERVMGPAVPSSVRAQDPYGIDAWAQGAGPTPGLMTGSILPIEAASERAFLANMMREHPALEKVFGRTARKALRDETKGGLKSLAKMIDPHPSRPGEYVLKPSVQARLAHFYGEGGKLGTQADWKGLTPEFLDAFGGDEQLGKRWMRFWAATSPNTSVPVNTREAVAVWRWVMENRGAELTKAGARGTALAPAKLTMAGSKVPNINRILAGHDLSGEKVKAMAGFMLGDPRIPIDVHALSGLGIKGDKLDPEIARLRKVMGKAENRPAKGRGSISRADTYLRFEQAMRDSLTQLDPERSLNDIFAQYWEGVRSAKGQKPQGGVLDILRKKGLLEYGAMLDPERLTETLKQQKWTAGAIAALLALLRQPDGASPPGSPEVDGQTPHDQPTP